MIDPQENITIGNFLYALGLGIGCRAGVSAPPAAVNLLQQTSYDPALGDVMLQFPGAIRLLEFKRSKRSDRRKEIAKHTLLGIALAGEEEMLRVSRSIHFYVETGPGEPEFRFRVCPYLDLGDKTIGHTRFDAFVNDILDEALGARKACVSTSQSHRYIRDIVGTWGSAGHPASTGLLVSVSGDGGLHYAVVDDLADLAQTAQRALALQMDRFQVVENMAEKIDRALQTRNQSVEPDLGDAREQRSVDRGPDRRDGMTR